MKEKDGAAPGSSPGASDQKEVDAAVREVRDARASFDRACADCTKAYDEKTAAEERAKEASADQFRAERRLRDASTHLLALLGGRIDPERP